MLNTKELTSRFVRSSTVRTTAIVLSVMGVYASTHQTYENYLDQQVPIFSQENGRRVVSGPGYRIKQAEIDPTIISVMKEPHSVFDSRGFERGKKILERLCGDTRFSILYEDPVRSLHVKKNNAESCLESSL